MRRALITGAGGFIGRALAERLRADGAEVVGVDLAADPERDISAADVTESGEWQGLAAGCDVVFHTAAAVTNSAGMDRAWRVNVMGTRRALDAAIAGGAGRFVHLSSIRAFSDRGFPDGVGEQHPIRPDGGSYVDTKIASEQVVLQAAARGDIDCAVIRPGDVYGPGSRPWTILPVEMIAAGRFVLPARGRGLMSPVYVDDLVEGAVLAADRPEARNEVFTITGRRGVRCDEFFGHYGRMLGKRVPSLPTPLALALAIAPEIAARLGGVETEFRRESVHYLARTGTYSIEKARERLGYEPAVNLDEGMRRTAEWLAEQGFLRQKS